MVAADRKLAALASALTPRERAILQVGAWCREEDSDDRLVRYCPPLDRVEFERSGEAIRKFGDEFHAFMVMGRHRCGVGVDFVRSRSELYLPTRGRRSAGDGEDR